MKHILAFLLISSSAFCADNIVFMGGNAMQASAQNISAKLSATETSPGSGIYALNTNAADSGTIAATQSGTWTVQPGNTANTTAWLVTGTGGTFPVTGTFWQATQPVSGTVTATVSGFSYTNITTATTTVVKSGSGTLHGVTINTKGTVASTATIYDNTAGSGTKIAVIDTLNLSGAFFYDANFSTGVTIVTTGTIAPDITVMWR